MVTLNSDGGANASYIAQFNDEANLGRDPVVSVWIEALTLQATPSTVAQPVSKTTTSPTSR